MRSLLSLRRFFASKREVTQPENIPRATNGLSISLKRKWLAWASQITLSNNLERSSISSSLQ